MRLEVFHETRYDYASPVSMSHHVAHLQPVDDAAQRLLAFDLDVAPAPQHRRNGFDAAGNAVCRFGVLGAHESLTVRATSLIDVHARFGALDAAASPPWEAVAARLRPHSCFEPAVEYALPSAHVPRLAALREVAAPAFAPGRPVAEAAVDLMRRIHADFAYVAASTEVDTPVAQVLAERRGVCQDFAHLMAGACRMLGLAARYVSGYLLTSGADGRTPMLGADASHAWVQVWCPDSAGIADGWLDLDPTNDVVPDAGHVRVAVGRDYGDVAPLRGVIRGGGAHRLTVAVGTRVVGPEVAIG